MQDKSNLSPSSGKSRFDLDEDLLSPKAVGDDGTRSSVGVGSDEGGSRSVDDASGDSRVGQDYSGGDDGSGDKTGSKEGGSDQTGGEKRRTDETTIGDNGTCKNEKKKISWSMMNIDRRFDVFCRERTRSFLDSCAYLELETVYFF